jgi:hypothetical protein
VWRNRTGGSQIIDFTAEMRRLPGFYPNNTEEVVKWERLDPHHMQVHFMRKLFHVFSNNHFRTPNARYLEVYHLKPNTTYEFRIWANNEVGQGEMCTISARTIEPVQEKGLKTFNFED